jgi:hypothetical protein
VSMLVLEIFEFETYRNNRRAGTFVPRSLKGWPGSL